MQAASPMEKFTAAEGLPVDKECYNIYIYIILPGNKINTYIYLLKLLSVVTFNNFFIYCQRVNGTHSLASVCIEKNT